LTAPVQARATQAEFGAKLTETDNTLPRRTAAAPIFLYGLYRLADLDFRADRPPSG
jgi:hypothetical protein